MASCAIDPQDSVTRLEDASVPFQLLDPEAPTVVAQPGGRDYDVCVLDDDRLVTSERRLPLDASLLDVVQAVAEVTDAEAGRGWQTALPAPDQVEGVRLTGGTATVDLTGDTPPGAAGDPLATVAQLVCTLTAQPGVGLVRFSIDGDPIEVPRADGTLTADAVTRDDYSSLLV